MDSIFGTGWVTRRGTVIALVPIIGGGGCVANNNGVEGSVDNPSTSKLGIQPVSDESEVGSDAEIVPFTSLSRATKGEFEKILPQGGIECDDAPDVWRDMSSELPDGGSVYLKYEGELYAPYLGIADQEEIFTGNPIEIEFGSCR
jgi:hypothetical protein